MAMHEAFSIAKKLGGTIVREFSQGQGEDFPWLKLTLAMPPLPGDRYVRFQKAKTSAGCCAALTNYFFIKHHAGQSAGYWDWISKPSGISKIMNAQTYFDGHVRGALGTELGQGDVQVREGTNKMLTENGLKFFAATQNPSKPFNPSAFRDDVVRTWSMKTYYKRIGIFGAVGGHAIGAVISPSNFMFLDVNEGLVSFKKLEEFKSWLILCAGTYYTSWIGSQTGVQSYYVHSYEGG